MASPADDRADQEAVIRAKLSVTTSTRQFVQQPLCLFQVEGVEALGEPGIDRREQIMRLSAPALFAP